MEQTAGPVEGRNCDKIAGAASSPNASTGLTIEQIKKYNFANVLGPR